VTGATPPLVHGMDAGLVPAVWPALTDDEVRAVLARYERRLGLGVERAVVTWRSPRPLSAAALVSLGPTSVFVKRHDQRVRTPGQLTVEHAFAALVRGRGQPVPEVLTTDDGVTVVHDDTMVYEVQARTEGIDTYRDVPSWGPFTSLGHARAAGRALARFHRAAAGFSARARPPAVLTGSTAIVSAPDPVAALGRLLADRPGLARATAGRPLLDDFIRHHVPVIGRLAGPLGRLPTQWAHGDWHPSNLTWSSLEPSAEVAGVLDLGLANRTAAVHDLAVAIERSAVDWLGAFTATGVRADWDAADALVDGYEDVRPLRPEEAAALADGVAVAHVEYALSEIEYFGDVVGSPRDMTLAYDGYFVGHSRWFESDAGVGFLDHLRARASAALGR
jgi:Ser/Thr protein kinase RdoA (MazF antagonist)